MGNLPGVTMANLPYISGGTADTGEGRLTTEYSGGGGGGLPWVTCREYHDPTP